MNQDPLVQYLVERVEKIDEKVDRLLQFKWQIVGGSMMLSVIAAIVIQVLALIFK